jgi:hypothetical protein
MKEEEVAIPQFRERMFIDLMMEDDGNEESEEELRFRNESKSEGDEFSSIENESVVSNMDDDDTNRDYNVLMNRER